MDAPTKKGRMTAALLVAMVLYAFASGMMNVLLNDIIAAFSVVGTQQGLMISTISMGTMVAVLTAPIIQRGREKRTLIFGSLLMLGVFTTLTGLASSFWVLLAICLPLGFAMGWSDVFLSSSIVDLHPENSARYSSYLHGCYGLGSLTLPLLLQPLSSHSDWRGTYLLFGTLIFVGFFVVVFLFGTGRRTPSPTPAAPANLTLGDVVEYLSRRRNRLLWLCAFFAFSTQTGLVSWISRYMLLRFDDPRLGGWAISAYWICTTLGRFVAPYIRQTPMVLYSWGMGLFSLCIGAGLAVGSGALLCAAIALAGLVSGHTIPMLISECAQGYQEKTTLTTAAVMMSMCLCRIVMPLLQAWLTGVAGPLAGMLTVPALGVLGVMVGIMVIRAPEQACESV